MGERLAREIGLWSRHLHERELERQAWIAALPHVLDGVGQQVDQPHDGGFGELIRLLAQPLARLLRDGQRVGHVVEVLDEQEMPEVLEQIAHEAPDVLTLLAELLDEQEGAGGVVVDDRVAEAKQRVLLDRADELKHILHRDLAPGGSRELVERGHGIAESTSSPACDQRECGVRSIDALGIGHAAQHRDELLQSRALEHERLTA